MRQRQATNFLEYHFKKGIDTCAVSDKKHKTNLVKIERAFNEIIRGIQADKPIHLGMRRPSGNGRSVKKSKRDSQIQIQRDRSTKLTMADNDVDRITGINRPGSTQLESLARRFKIFD